MTQFKKGDEVLVSEDWYYDNSKQKMYYYYDKAVLTFDYEIDGYSASALDVNKKLLAENARLRNNQSILITSFRINMMRLRPDYSHEEFDKDIAAMLKEKE